RSISFHCVIGASLISFDIPKKEVSLLRALPYILVVASICLPAFAQNTDIQSIQGLQFNFSNPGARALGMGGAFLGLADDASAAEGNPAGVPHLRKPHAYREN